MQRTNIYLEDRQAEALKQIGEARSRPVAGIVREAIDRWLDAEGVEVVSEEEWADRLGRLLASRQEIASEGKFSSAEVDRDVADAIREVRKARAARRR